MKKVITYGTFDLLHYGHINLLKRAKALGDYLIVGITADSFDRERGKINVTQSLIERIEGVKNTGLADEIIVEEYEGQKIDDIKRHGVDIFTVGSDWVGKFDYLNEYCKVVYLDRTEGVSSSEIRINQNKVKFGIVGEAPFISKYLEGIKKVNGLEFIGIFAKFTDNFDKELKALVTDKDYESFLDGVDAVYVASLEENYKELIEKALKKGKHVLCESPLALTKKDNEYLHGIAKEMGCVLSEAIKTAYSTAYERLLLLVKSGIIGKIVSVEATCTSLIDGERLKNLNKQAKTIYDWGPSVLLPAFCILGTDYIKKEMVVGYFDKEKKFDSFTNIRLTYKDSVANLKIAKGVKSEGELIVSGTKGYVFVPAPWWKTEYFEVKYEDQNKNKRFFFQLDNEGINNELLSFIKSIQTRGNYSEIDGNVSESISAVMEDFNNGKDVLEIVF